ncbi:MAG: hypothetical protein IJJ24_10515 [Solobacterium sp.]|nr:hypothetical protein [Solobacterium sp.]MBR0479512.1 hypothetical protein [Solobacterium sp.]
MKRILKKSLIVSLAVCTAGFLINLVSWRLAGRLVFYRTLSGGEWMGYEGFGLLVNRTFPMSSADHPVSGSTWLTIDPSGLIIPLIAVFILAAAVLTIRERIHTGGKRI